MSAFHYSNKAYRYVLHTNDTKGASASLQIKKSVLDRFVKSVGSVNTTGIPGLCVFQRAGGWVTITTMYERLQHLVTRFLGRLNTWYLQQSRDTELKPSSSSVVQTLTENSLHKNYSIVQQMNAATTARLAKLLEKFGRPLRSFKQSS